MAVATPLGNTSAGHPGLMYPIDNDCGFPFSFITLYVSVGGCNPKGRSRLPCVFEMPFERHKMALVGNLPAIFLFRPHSGSRAHIPEPTGMSSRGKITKWRCIWNSGPGGWIEESGH